MNVCAVIITYQPDLELLGNSLVSLQPQVQTILIVDNASCEPIKIGLRSLALNHGCYLIENSENLGVGASLNQGVAFARAKTQIEDSFILFLDQDSRVSPDFLRHEVEVYHQGSSSGPIGLVTPTIIKRSNGTRYPPVRLRNGDIALAQTSGALMPLAVFDDVGLFIADMFIDYVDYEHCLRMAQKGWKIAWASAAELDHMPGNSIPVRFLGKSINTVSASPIRHYYEVRNCLWIARRYFRYSPEMVTRLVVRMIRVRVRALVFESNRILKLKACMRGFFDAIQGHLGKYIDK